MKNSIFKNSILKLILTSCNILFPLIVSPYIASLFNQNQNSIDAFGAYNDANGIMYIFLAFSVFGVYNYGIREISKLRDTPIILNQVFTNLFFISIISSSLTSIFYYFFIVYTLKTPYVSIYLVMIIHLIGNALSIEWVNEAMENYKFITVKTIIVRIIYVTCVFTLVKHPNDIFLYALIVSLSNLVNNLISFIAIKKRLKFDFTDFNPKKYIKPLLAMLVINNATILYTQLDRFFLGRHFFEKVFVTEYSLPLNAVNMIGSMLVSLLIVTIPRLSYQLSNNDVEEYLKLLKLSSRVFFMLLFPACVGLACVSYEAMYLYTNGAYAYTADVLALFSLRFLLISIYSIFANQILYIHQKEKPLVIILLIGGIINIFSNLILMRINHFTPTTAIISTAVAEFIMLAIMYTYIRTKLNIDYTLFSFNNMKYLCYSLPFVPITRIVKTYNMGVSATFLVIAFCCMSFYGLILLITKDEITYNLLNKLKFKKAITKKEND